MRRYGLIGFVSLALLACVAAPSPAQAVSQGTAVAGAPDQATPPPGQTSATSQTPRPSGAPPPSPTGRGLGLAGADQNVRIEISITDTAGGTAATKVVTILVADGHRGQIRSSNYVAVAEPTGDPGGTNTQNRAIFINVDAIPRVRSEGRILLELTVQYVPEPKASGTLSQRPADINESLTVIVNDGKPTLVSQSADPANDRKVALEVKATIVK